MAVFRLFLGSFFAGPLLIAAFFAEVVTLLNNIYHHHHHHLHRHHQQQQHRHHHYHHHHHRYHHQHHRHHYHYSCNFKKMSRLPQYYSLCQLIHSLIKLACSFIPFSMKFRQS